MTVQEDYHAHVYFDASSRGTIATVQEGLRAYFGTRIRVSTLREKPVGPHPLPMFEVIFPAQEHDAVRQWLASNRLGHDILMHHVMENDLLAHEEYADWLGHSSLLQTNSEFETACKRV